MQALQFLKGLNQNPVQKDTIDLSNRKENSVSSFKSVLEDASRHKETTQKTNYKSTDGSDKELKNETTTPEGIEASAVKTTNPSKKETEGQDRGLLAQPEQDQLSTIDSTDIQLSSAEIVLFGQPVEQVTDAPFETDVGLSKLEDVTATETIFDLRSLPQDFHPEIANTEAIYEANSLVDSKESSAILGQTGLNFEQLASNDEKPNSSVTEDMPVQAFASLGNEEEKIDLSVAMQQQGSLEGQQKDESGDKGQNFQTQYSQTLGHIASENKFTVVDNRSVDAKRDSVKFSSVELKAESVQQHGNTLDITFNLNQEQGQMLAAEQNILSSSDQAAAGDASTFQRMLSNQLLNQAPEFVKAGSIILRDNNNGTINLNLKPEALGNVKITLHVTDKGIEGQIVVASKEAFEAFNQNMDNLKQSFRQSGFDATQLSLSLADASSQGQQFAQGDAHGQQQSGENFNANKAFGGWTDGEEKLPSSTIAAAYGAGGHEIDVVA